LSDNEIPLKHRLNLETGIITWKELQLFFAKGNLLQVQVDEDLVATAELIAENREKELSALIEKDKISFVQADWVKQNCQANSEFWAVVVAPYVICQIKN